MHHTTGHSKTELIHKISAKENELEEYNNIHDVRTLLEWTAPSRLYSKRQMTYYLNLLILMFALLVILFLFSQYILMLVVLSLAFVSYALASTPPADIKYRISTEGIAIDEHYYLWQELYDFYFKQRGKDLTLHIRTKEFLPGELIMLLVNITKDKMRNALIPYLPYREVVKNTLGEKAGDWLYKTFPLDETNSA